MSYAALTADDVTTLTTFFQAVDSNHDGYISVAEIKSACRVDTDGDGNITQAEVDASALPWLTDFVNQDLDNNAQISLAELLAYNNKVKGTQ